jgi:hypothetical protein
MSALPPKADVAKRDRHVRFVPKSRHRATLDPFSASPNFPAV